MAASVGDNSNVSKHKFNWFVDSFNDSDITTETFPMHIVEGFYVTCFAACSRSFHIGIGNYYSFSYELSWDKIRNKSLLYSSEVRLTTLEGFLWWEHGRRGRKHGGHVNSIAFPPIGKTTKMLIPANAIVAHFDFEFNLKTLLDDFIRDFSTPMITLTMPLLEEQSFTDVVVVCADMRINCHKAVLAGRSEVFKKMLTGSFKEARDREINIKSFDAEVVKLLIEFIYADKVVEDAVTWELFEAAKMYELPRLQTLCLRALRRKKLSVDNCFEVLHFTFKHDLDEFFNVAMRFLRKNKTAMGKTDEWKSLAESNKLLAKMLFKTL